MIKQAKFMGMIGGAILVLYTIPHYFTGYPLITREMEIAGAEAELIQSVQTIWIFASLTMLCTGLVAFFAGIQMDDNPKLSRNILFIAGALVFLFATIAQIRSFPDTNLAIFYIPAVFMLIGAFLPSIQLKQ
jgi:hypothetical protein